MAGLHGADTDEVGKGSGLIAAEDYYDLREADTVISFTEAPRVMLNTRGGRHVEYGMALAWRKRLIVIGPRENVFHELAIVEQFDRWGPDVLRSLCDEVGRAWLGQEMEWGR